ncbi:MAG: hypothetical protein AABZ75_00280 [candidate division NC10 bacterium]
MRGWWRNIRRDLDALVGMKAVGESEHRLTLASGGMLGTAAFFGSGVWTVGFFLWFRRELLAGHPLLWMLGLAGLGAGVLLLRLAGETSIVSIDRRSRTVTLDRRYLYLLPSRQVIPFDRIAQVLIRPARRLCAVRTVDGREEPLCRLREGEERPMALRLRAFLGKPILLQRPSGREEAWEEMIA